MKRSKSSATRTPVAKWMRRFGRDLVNADLAAAYERIRARPDGPETERRRRGMILASYGVVLEPADYELKLVAAEIVATHLDGLRADADHAASMYLLVMNLHALDTSFGRLVRTSKNGAKPSLFKHDVDYVIAKHRRARNVAAYLILRVGAFGEEQYDEPPTNEIARVTRSLHAAKDKRDQRRFRADRKFVHGRVKR